MKTQDITEASGEEKQQTEFGGFKWLLEEFPELGERTLRDLVQSEVVPHIRLPHRRKLLFHKPSVRQAMLRHQTPLQAV